jgi:CubicO group peptidase (beta-lactamase class C family)
MAGETPQDVTGRLLESLCAAGQETGVQVAAYQHGEQVVSACAGQADAGAGRPVHETTLFHCWSAGKGSMATVVHVLAERGLLDYQAPVAEYWPEFAARGKSAITLAHVLTHTAGVPQVPAGLGPGDLADWDGTCAKIAALAPLWEPGTVTGYHAVTFGYILGEVARRVTGRPVAYLLEHEVARPLGIAGELFFGVPRHDHDRVARLEDGNWPAVLARRPAGSLFVRAAPDELQARAELGNQADYLATDVPCAGTMTARALARMYAALIGAVDGVRLVGPGCTALISTAMATGHDRVLAAPVPKTLGYFTGLPEMGQHPRAFGAKGSGGSIAFADPEHGFSFALAHNRLTAPPCDVAAHVAEHVRRALGIDGTS